MFSAVVSRLIILVFGTLYPAYSSYKAVKTKNVKEYVKWMMYWIVFALFTCFETFTDVFLCWFPFYYELKIIIVLWLLSPATKGSSILYRKFVHPLLSRREQEIDEYLNKAKEQGYHTVLQLGTQGVNFAAAVIMQSAIKGGGGLVNQLKKSYSLSDLSIDKDARTEDERDGEEESTSGAETRILRSYAKRSQSGPPNRVDMYFPEVDVDLTRSCSSSTVPTVIRSNDDISSGYSSAEYVATNLPTSGTGALIRTASVGGTTRSRTKTIKSSTILTKKTLATPTENEMVTIPSSTLLYLLQQVDFFNKPEPAKEEVFFNCESESSDEREEFNDARSSDNVTIASGRSGRYNKRAAPAPPIKAYKQVSTTSKKGHFKFFKMLPFFKHKTGDSTSLVDVAKTSQLVVPASIQRSVSDQELHYRSNQFRNNSTEQKD